MADSPIPIQLCTSMPHSLRLTLLLLVGQEEQVEEEACARFPFQGICLAVAYFKHGTLEKEVRVFCPPSLAAPSSQTLQQHKPHKRHTQRTSTERHGMTQSGSVVESVADSLFDFFVWEVVFEVHRSQKQGLVCTCSPRTAEKPKHKYAHCAAQIHVCLLGGDGLCPRHHSPPPPCTSVPLSRPLDLSTSVSQNVSDTVGWYARLDWTSLAKRCFLETSTLRALCTE